MVTESCVSAVKLFVINSNDITATDIAVTVIAVSVIAVIAVLLLLFCCRAL